MAPPSTWTSACAVSAAGSMTNDRTTPAVAVSTSLPISATPNC